MNHSSTSASVSSNKYAPPQYNQPSRLHEYSSLNDPPHATPIGYSNLRYNWTMERQTDQPVIGSNTLQPLYESIESKLKPDSKHSSNENSCGHNLTIGISQDSMSTCGAYNDVDDINAGIDVSTHQEDIQVEQCSVNEETRNQESQISYANVSTASSQNQMEYDPPRKQGKGYRMSQCEAYDYVQI